MTSKRQVLLLGITKYGDYDAILHCYGKEEGFTTYFYKNVFKTKKRAFLQPLIELSIEVQPSKGDLERISKIEINSHAAIEWDIKKNSIIFFVAELLQKILREEPQNTTLYQEILKFKDELYNDKHYAHLTLMVLILEQLGVAPLTASQPFLNPETAHFEDLQSSSHFDETITSLWRDILNSEEPYHIDIKGNFRKPFLESLLLYYSYHVNHFKIPQSLEILKQIFED